MKRFLRDWGTWYLSRFFEIRVVTESILLSEFLSLFREKSLLVVALVILLLDLLTEPAYRVVLD